MRSTLSMMVLAGTLGLMMCGETYAQRGNGNRGNGGARPNAYPGYNSGYNFGSNNFGLNNLGGYRGGFGNGTTLGTILGYGSQGQYYNNGNGYYQSSPSYAYPSQGTTYYTTPSVMYAPSTSGTIVQGSPNYDTSTVPTMMPAASTTGKAVIEVTVPTADAKVLFGTTLVDMPGRERRYESSEIALGQKFTYTITARWMNDGKPMEQVQVVDVMAGKTSKATFRNEDATRQLPAPEPTREK